MEKEFKVSIKTPKNDNVILLAGKRENGKDYVSLIEMPKDVFKDKNLLHKYADEVSYQLNK